jgi:hypothetical protein
MFIKNYSDTDYVIKYNGNEKTLCAKDVTYIDDNWITFALIHSMFGNWVGLVDNCTPIEDFLFDNQILAEADKVYKVVGVGPGTPRVFIKGGTATLYFADLTPTDIDDMSESQEYSDVSGLILLNYVTNFIGYKTSDNAKVIFTNIDAV